MNIMRIRNYFYVFRLVCVVLLVLSIVPEPASAAGICGSGSWQPGNLEIHHINIGQGDATLIVGPTGRSLLFDAGESHWKSSAKAQIIGPYIEGVLGCKSLDYVLVSHFHVDHIGYVGYGGLWHLVEIQGFSIGTTLVRNYSTHLGSVSGTFTNWKTYLEGAGQSKLHPAWAIEGSGQVDLGAGVALDIVAVNGNGAILPGDFHADANPPSENDYSIGAVLSYGGFDEWIGGDFSGQYESSGFGYTYHDIELSAAPEVGDVDVYKVNHHASSHSSSTTFVNQLDPEVSIVTVGDGNNYGHPAQGVMDRLLETSLVFMTERGDTNTTIGSAIVSGHIVIKTTNGSTYTVNGAAFSATEPSRSDVDGDGYFAEADPDDTSSELIPAPNGGCDPVYQTCSISCQVTPGQVLINEIFPSPSVGAEWVELYNTTASPINIGHCYIDDIPAGSPAYQIPASTLIPARGFWTLDRTSYFNNPGDTVRFLKEDGTTLLDSHTYGSTNHNLAWYRFPDGGNWSAASTTSITKGQSNTLPFYPIVSSSVRADPNDTFEASVRFTVTFSKAVTGVNTSPPFQDFGLTKSGVTGAFISGVSGSGGMYTVTVNTGSGDGTIRLDVIDDDSIRDAGNHPLGGIGTGNGNFTGGQTYTINKPTNVNVYIGETLKGKYLLASNESTRQSYVNTNSGPVRIIKTDQGPLMAAERVIYKVRGVNTSFSEMMGLPDSQLDTTYWLPWYNNVGLDTQLRFANVSNSTATVQLYIGGVEKTSGCTPSSSPYTLAVGASLRVSCAGVDSGPVEIRSTQNIVAAERVIYKVNGVHTSFSEIMALPNKQLDTTYWLPWYNNVGLDTQLRFGNVSNSTATVQLFIGGVEKTTGCMPSNSPFTLPVGESLRVSCAGVDSGPVEIRSDVDIVAAERVIYKVNGVQTSFSEMMALPDNQLDTTFWFPWYNNVDLDTQLRFANVTDTPATINIYVGGAQVGDPISLAVGESTRVSFPSISNGPVQIVSDVPIVASERVIYKVNNVNTSFSEMMGLPDKLLDPTYWLPWYNNIDLDTQLRFAVP